MRTILEYIKKTKSSNYEHGIIKGMDVSTFDQVLKDNGYKYNMQADKIYDYAGETGSFLREIIKDKSYIFTIKSGAVNVYQYYMYPGAGGYVVFVGFDENRRIYQFSLINKLGNWVKLLVPDNPDDIEEMNILLGFK